MRMWTQENKKECYQTKVISGIYHYICIFANTFSFNHIIFNNHLTELSSKYIYMAGYLLVSGSACF